MSANVYRTAATGIGAIAETFIVPVGQTYRVVSVTLHLNAASVTHENFTITLDAVNGAAYDTVLYLLDPTDASTVNLLWQPDQTLYLIGGDALDVAWANTDGRVWGLLVTMEGV